MVFSAEYLSLFTAFSIVSELFCSELLLGCFSEYCSGVFPNFFLGFDPAGVGECAVPSPIGLWSP